MSEVEVGGVVMAPNEEMGRTISVCRLLMCPCSSKRGTVTGTTGTPIGAVALIVVAIVVGFVVVVVGIIVVGIIAVGVEGVL